MHIGYPKTATTALQQHAFPALFGARYLGKKFSDPNLESAVKKMIQWDGLHFDAQDVQSTLVAVADDVRGQSKLPAVVSHEGFTSPIVPVVGRTIDRRLMAERCKAVFGDAKILIVLRNQLTLLPSLFAQLVLKNNARHLRWLRPEDWIEDALQHPRYGPIAGLDYNALVNTYDELFGAENVRIWLFEELVKDPQAHYRSLLEFIGQTGPEDALPALPQANRTPYTNRWLAYRAVMRWLDPIDPIGWLIHPATARRFFEGGKKVSVRLGPNLNNRLCGAFAESNTKLAVRRKLDMERCGYPMVAAASGVESDYEGIGMMRPAT